jgi:hypothetical protein
VLGAAAGSSPTGFVPAVSWRGQTAVWIARAPPGIAALSFDQRLVELRLHSGTVDAGASGWRWGPAVVGSERRRLVAAFNGGFKLSTGAGGFMSYGRVGATLRYGLGSIVTYADGRTDVGAWRVEVPVPGSTVVSVRQNLTLLIDHGQPAPGVGCNSCWGATLGGVGDPARSGLGITADGHLVWAAGEHLTVAQLARALLSPSGPRRRARHQPRVGGGLPIRAPPRSRAAVGGPRRAGAGGRVRVLPRRPQPRLLHDRRAVSGRSPLRARTPASTDTATSASIERDAGGAHQQHEDRDHSRDGQTRRQDQYDRGERRGQSRVEEERSAAHSGSLR